MAPPLSKSASWLLAELKLHYPTITTVWLLSMEVAIQRVQFSRRAKIPCKLKWCLLSCSFRTQLWLPLESSILHPLDPDATMSATYSSYQETSTLYRSTANKTSLAMTIASMREDSPIPTARQISENKITAATAVVLAWETSATQDATAIQMPDADWSLTLKKISKKKSTRRFTKLSVICWAKLLKNQLLPASLTLFKLIE